MSGITLVSLYLNKYVHNDLISDSDLFRIPEAIFSSDQAAPYHRKSHERGNLT